MALSAKNSGPSFIVLTTPAADTFKDGGILHMENGIDWDACLSLLKKIHNQETEKCSSVIVIEGKIVPITDDFSKIKYGSVEYPLKEDSSSYIEDDFVMLGDKDGRAVD